MYITKIAILNYKSCQGLHLNVQKDRPNTLIGMNDCGKTAILRAIGHLLEAKSSLSVSNDVRSTSDISNTILGKEKCDAIFTEFKVPVFPSIEGTAIMAEFKIEENEITEEFIEVASTQFKWAIETSPDNFFTILKYYTNDDANGKHFFCIGESESKHSLWNRKAAELQTIRKENKLADADIKNENNKGRFASLELIRAIYNKVGYKRSWSEASGFIKTDLPLLPKYRYIDWTTSLKDVENLANDVMNSKIETSKAKLTKQAQELSQQATDEVNKEFEELTKELTQDLKTITGIKAKVNFSVEEKVSDLIINKVTGDGDIRLDSQGEGVKRQILFAFLKWASKKDIGTDNPLKKFIWCFDEPESHLYPTAQRDLYSIVSDLAKSNYQIFLGTHSTIFVDRSRLSEIFQIKLEDKYSEILKCTTVEEVHTALGVKNSDILFFDKFLAVEGESEDILIPHFYKLHTGNSMDEDAIQLIPLGGIGEYQHNKQILENILNDFKKTTHTTYYIFDSDTASVGENVFLVGTCDLEDLIPNNLWIKLIQEQCGITLDDATLNEMRNQLDPAVAARKFHKLMASNVAGNEARTAFLPSKRTCAELFRTYITDPVDIPAQLLAAFNQITAKQ